MDCKIPKNFYAFEYGWHKGIDFDKEAEALLKVLNNATKENDLQRYIKQNEKWFIPASIFECFDFGHHEAYLVPEQPLANNYRADYMLMGRNSLGYHIVFVEFEDVNVDYRLQNANVESNPVRKGLAQIKDWNRWFQDNRKFFLDNNGLSEIAGNIPPWGIWYVLVVGRRDRMDNNVNQMRGEMLREGIGIKIISYDRLVDNVRLLSNGF